MVTSNGRSAGCLPHPGMLFPAIGWLGGERRGGSTRDCRARGTDHSSRKALFLARSENFEAGSGALLPFRGEGRAGRHPRASAGAQAIRQWSGRRSVLPKAGAGRPAAMAANRDSVFPFGPDSRRSGGGRRGRPKTSGSRGMHINVRIEPRWTFYEVRRAAVALSRAIERRLPGLASSKWWKEERHGVFLDYNQNARDRTTCSAYSVRPLPDARVSTPLYWHEVPDCEPSDFTATTVPKRFAAIGDPHAGIETTCGSLEKLLELAARDEAAGLPDAPWPPHFPKMRGEGPRIAPSRAKAATKQARVKMPLVVVARSPDRASALAGLDRWRTRHPEVAALLSPDDVLVDSLRGRSSTWTRVRVNLRNVPEHLRPSQEDPDPDYDPAGESQKASAKRNS